MKKFITILSLVIISLEANAAGYRCDGPLFSGCSLTPVHICMLSGYRGCVVVPDGPISANRQTYESQNLPPVTVDPNFACPPKGSDAQDLYCRKLTTRISELLRVLPNGQRSQEVIDVGDTYKTCCNIR